MSEKNPTRRDFVETAARSALAAAFVPVGFPMIVPRHVLGGPGFQAPSDTLNIAIVGFGGMGSGNAEVLAQAEAKVHDTTPDRVHFHEVGAVDSIIDIVGTAWGLDHLGVGNVLVSPLPMGNGFARSQHGVIPVPAPATAELLKGFPLKIGDGAHEMVTPTGAAVVRALARPAATARTRRRGDVSREGVQRGRAAPQAPSRSAAHGARLAPHCSESVRLCWRRPGRYRNGASRRRARHRSPINLDGSR